MGMETSITIRTTFTNGFVLDKEICHMCKHWNVRDLMLRTFDLSGSDGGHYKLNRSDIYDLRSAFYTLITKTPASEIHNNWDRGSLINFYEMIGHCIGELEAAYRYTNREITFYLYYEDEIDDVTFDPSELCVDKIEVFFEDSP